MTDRFTVSITNLITNGWLGGVGLLRGGHFPSAFRARGQKHWKVCIAGTFALREQFCGESVPLFVDMQM